MPREDAGVARRSSSQSIMKQRHLKRVLVFQHMEQEGPGLFARLMKQSGLDHDVVHLYRGDPIPPS